MIAAMVTAPPVVKICSKSMPSSLKYPLRWAIQIGAKSKPAVEVANLILVGGLLVP